MKVVTDLMNAVVQLLGRDLDELVITARELELLELVDVCYLINQTLGGSLGARTFVLLLIQRILHRRSENLWALF